VTVSSIKATALSGVILGVMAVPLSVRAQSSSDFETGGVQLTFGVTFGVDAEDNRALDPIDKVSATEVYTDLTLGLLTETRTQRLSFDLGARLRHLNTDAAFSTNNGLVEPFARLRYDISNRSSRFSFDVLAEEQDLSDPDVLLDDETGLEIINAGTTLRRRNQIETSLDWGDDRRFGFGIFATYVETKFTEGTAFDPLDGQALNDTESRTIGARARFDLSQAVTWNTTLSLQTFEEDNVPGTRDTVSLNNSVSLDRPRGPVTFSLDVADTEEGSRTSTSAGRVFELPGGVLSGAIGASRAATGDDTFFTGNLSYVHDLPRGRLSFGIERGVTSGDTDDSERLRTQVNMRYNQDLTPVSGLDLSINWVENEETGSGLTSTGTTLGATYRHELTADWDLNLGYRHRISDNDLTGSANNNTVFFEMSRAFVTRF